MKKRPIDKKIEEKVNIDFSFNDIENRIDLEKYENNKNNKRIIFPILTPILCSLFCFVIIGVSIFNGNENDKNPETSDKLNTSIFLESTKDNNSNLENDEMTEEENNSLLLPEVGTNNSDEYFVDETYEKYDGILIDAIKKENPDKNSYGPSLKLDLYEVIVNDYSIYEVSYLGNIEDNYYCAYVDIDTANEIYDLYNDVLDVETASETNIIDGSIIKWFYSKKYSENLISWYKISIDKKIPRIIDNKMVLGVYTLENVCINKEITTGYDINRTYNYYCYKRFIYEEGKYITSNYVNNIRKVWYSSSYDVDNLEFDKDYFNYFKMSLNDFNTLALVNDNEIKFYDDVSVIINPIDENQEKWNSFVNEISSFKIEKNIYYYDDIVNVFIK